MTYDRFKEIWTTLVTNRAAPEAAVQKPALINGLSDNTVDALVAVADGDHSRFDEIEKALADHDAK